MAGESTVLGMLLAGDDDAAQPLGALVIVKYLDEDGKLRYRPRCTEGITTVEAIGMAMMASDALRDALRGAR